VFPIHTDFVQANVKIKQNYGFSDATEEE
jgi:hypothetical protein